MRSNAHCRLMLNAPLRSLTMSRRSVRPSVGARAERIWLHRQLADSRVHVRIVASCSDWRDGRHQPKTSSNPLTACRFHVLTWFGLDIMSGGDLQHRPVPRNASSATRFLKAVVNRGRGLVAIRRHSSVSRRLRNTPASAEDAGPPHQVGHHSGHDKVSGRVVDPMSLDGRLALRS